MSLKGEDFDHKGTLQISFDYFYQLIEEYIPADSREEISGMLGTRPATGNICIDQLTNLRMLEER